MQELLAALETSKLHTTLYHFTDRRNLPSIARHGLLSLRRLRDEGIAIPAPGGNQESHDIDGAIGMDRYVHLCFLDSHPMEYRAKERGAIGTSIFLRVSPEILKTPGVRFTDDVANKAGVVPGDASLIDDLQVIYQKTQWSDPVINARLQRAKRFEILVPDHVPASFLGKA